MNHDYLRKILQFQPETGLFVWSEKRGGTKGIGSRAGVVLNTGYRQIMIDGKHFSEHRLAFFWMTGRWPSAHVDHINGDRGDNRWCNLREATPGENLQNMKVDKRNKSGWRGVSWATSVGKWQASISADRKALHLGFYENAEDAGRAYLNAKARLHTFAPVPREGYR